MSDNMCKWKPKYAPEYECPEDPLPNAPDGHCILHSRDEKKDLEAFKQKVQKRIDTTGNRIDLMGCYFPKDFPAEYFRKHTFDKPVYFIEAAFSQDANFSGANFSQEANFSEAIFAQRADFSGATFSQEAHFRRAEFSQMAYFSGATFSQANFFQTEFVKGADFVGAEFSQEANFFLAKFSELAEFSETKFSQKAIFFDVKFQVAIFSKAKFSQVAYFPLATFVQPAYFSEATFSLADFSGAKFSKGADFSKAEFLGDTNFTKTIFERQKTDFREAKFKGDVNFSDTQFKCEEVSFCDTEFIEKGEVKFDNPHFYSQVYFIRTEFDKPCKFWWSEFPRTQKQAVFENTNLSKCSFLYSDLDKVNFRYCKFNEKSEKFLFLFTNRRQNVLKDELDAEEETNKNPKDKKFREEKYGFVHDVYRELKRNFEEKRDWNTAGDFHYGEMESRRKMKDGWLGRYILSLEALYYWASGYGERPLRAGFWMMLLILVCALFYMPSMDKVSPSQVLEGAGQTAAQEPAGNTMQGHPATPDLLVEGCSGRACSTYFKKYLEGLNTSLRVTARLDTEKKGWPRTIQSILGPILIALFFLALRRKVKR